MNFKELIILLLLSSCYISDELPPDQTVWNYDLPSNVNLNQSGLLDLNTRIRALEFEQIRGLTIIKDHKLVFENYYGGNSRISINELSTASMAITVAAIGVALDKNLISLDDRIEDYLPEYADIFENDNNKTFITVKHLLLNKSGLSWSADDPFLMKSSPDWVRYVLAKPMQASAGLQYNLDSGSGILLAKIIANQSGQSFQDFVDIHIFQPLQITNSTIAKDSNDNYNGEFGISLSHLDFTKIGYLMLEEGIWNGRRIIDPNFVEEATTLQTNVSGRYNSGFFWKKFGDDFQNAFGINYEDVYFITGEIGQHLYVIPSKKMVIAIDAENYFFDFRNPSLNLLVEISYLIQ